MTVHRVHRDVRLLRRAGDSTPTLHERGCWIDVRPEGLHVRIAEPGPAPGVDLGAALARLRRALLRRLPPALGAGVVAEVGVVRTASWEDDRRLGSRESGYALALCADTVVMLAGDVHATAGTPWRRTCSLDDVDRGLPVALGPSAVLALTAGALELGDQAGELPGWISVEHTRRSPYPPQDDPCELLGLPESAAAEELMAAVASWGAHTERWLRPMWTARARRGQYDVRTTLPRAAGRRSAVRVESLVSLDTLGRLWQASLSIVQGGGRACVAAPVRLEARAGDLLRSACQEVEPSQPALDRDPIDGECFGWAPCLLTELVAEDLGLRPSPGAPRRLEEEGAGPGARTRSAP
jgi:hypothetical protein